MATPHFYLKKPEPSGMALIYLQYKYNGKKLVYTFGETIRPDNWDNKAKKPKEKKTTTANGLYLLKDTLDNLAKECEKAYYELLPNGVPTPEMIKAKLEDWRQKHFKVKAIEAARPTFMQLVDRFVLGEMKIMIGKQRGKEKAPNTLKSYQTTKGHLEGYQKRYKATLDFDNITLDWYMKFTSFLKNEGLTGNSIGKQVKNVKAFMAMANKLTYEMDGKKYPYTTNKEYQSFGVTDTPADAVYLSEAEIMKLYHFDLSGNKRLEAVRDLFVFGCMVGLRYSDYSTIKPQNIIEMEGELFIRTYTQKTGELVVIPCNPVVLDIFKKYKNSPNRLPRKVSDQKFNEYIKEAANMAGLIAKGRLLTKPGLELWECISSHTARRSFATNYYLSGFPTIDLMKITGHQSEQSFLRYIRITKEETAKRLAAHNRGKNWAVLVGGIQEKALRVAS